MRPRGNGARLAPHEPVRALWVGPRLSRIERLSLASFLAAGHPVELFTYGPVAGVPAGVSVRDGEDVLPRSAIRRYGPTAGEGQGSWAFFANLFRYQLLLQRGGWWVDTDVVACRPLPRAGERFFAYESADVINTAVLRLPAGDPLAEELLATTAEVGHDSAFGETGPRLITALVRLMGLEAAAAPARTVYPIPHGEAESIFRADPLGRRWARIRSAYAVHLWQEVLRRRGMSKNGRWPSTSPIERLARRVERPGPRPVPAAPDPDDAEVPR